MDLREYYEGLARKSESGTDVPGRVLKAAGLFRKHLKARARLLDIGCGKGNITAYLRQSLGIEEVYGIDIAAANVESARTRGVTACRTDCNQDDLPFKDGYFDAVFAGEVIEHVLDPDRLLGEIRRTMVAGGVLVVTSPNLGAWFNRLSLLLGWQPLGGGTSFYHDVGRPHFLRFGGGDGGTEHLRLYTLRALNELLQVNGFQILGTAAAPEKETERKIAWFYRPALAFDEAICFLPSLAARLVVAARRPE
jgi:methionine biosynthesis protein MetW